MDWSVALDILFLATAWIHVLLAPYTKVEESFNLHATHDILMYGVSRTALPNYDHFMFPGAVPRTFLGSILLAWSSTPVIHLAGFLGWALTKFDLQIITRLVLSTINAAALSFIRKAVSRQFGRVASLFFVLVTCSQFHLPFWMGRTLPNMFALFPVNMAWYLILSQAPSAVKRSSRTFYVTVALLVFTAVVFRSEILLLLGPLVLQALFLGHATFWNIVKVGLTSGLVSLTITVCVDSYFWDRWPLWPEFAGLYFNIYEGKSSDWGVSPFYTYFSSHLPKLLLGALPLSIFGSIVDPRIRSLLLPSIFFIILISGLAHKEWRFIVYTVPPFNVAAARGASWLVSRRNGSRYGYLVAIIGIIAANLYATVVLTKASIVNYPGGQALDLFNSRYAGQARVHVHLSNLATQTGASLFLHTYAPPYTQVIHTPSGLPLSWTYNKTETVHPHALTAASEITHLIAEEPCLELRKEWHYVASIAGFDRWKLNKELTKLGWMRGILTMVTRDKLCILERIHSHNHTRFSPLPGGVDTADMADIRPTTGATDSSP